MVDFVVRHNDRQNVRMMRTSKADQEPVTVDFEPWAEDRGALASATWSVESGNATISNESLSGSVASAEITTAERGMSLIRVLGANATYQKAVWIRVSAEEPTQPTYDYGW